MIHVSNLQKSFGHVQALNGISFNITDGEFYGLLGPNGAGKTTTISILSSILKPDEGEVIISGYNLLKNPVECKNVIGVIPQEIALYNELSALENLMFWGSLYLIPAGTIRKRAIELLQLFGLFERRKDKVKTYSGGMKRRINIAAALLHKPEILFMDEPTVGIDPQSRNLIFEVIEKLHRDGMTIIYTTHYMEEAERFCDRIGIIDNGQIIAQGTLNELKMETSVKEAVVITCELATAGRLNEIISLWKDSKRIDNKAYFYSGKVREDMSKIIQLCNQAGIEILNIEFQKTNLETIFLDLTGKQLRD
ncbi:MAG: ABC transporter ATP-binding protein [Bacteroidia bacterium]|nr:ABC transporter ATP-binding protein [Bacteroidia bacterium]MCZ2276934.1 ABC transporter ATP-binding protein [Bacteroidia bacterium]